MPKARWRQAQNGAPEPRPRFTVQGVEKRLAEILGPLVLAQGGQLCTFREWELDGYGVVIRAPTGQEFRISISEHRR